MCVKKWQEDEIAQAKRKLSVLQDEEQTQQRIVRRLETELRTIQERFMEHAVGPCKRFLSAEGKSTEQLVKGLEAELTAMHRLGREDQHEPPTSEGRASGSTGL